MKEIVVIDDSPIILEAVKRTLTDAGYSVTTFEDPSVCSPKAIGSPHLILVDINMPQFYGDDVVPSSNLNGESWPPSTSSPTSPNQRSRGARPHAVPTVFSPRLGDSTGWPST